MYYQQNIEYQLYSAKQNEKRRLSSIGKSCGKAVVSFAVLGTVLSLILFNVKGFAELYETNGIFSSAFTACLAVFTLFLPFLFSYLSLKKKNIIGELPFGNPQDKNDFFLLIPIAIMVCFIGSIFTGLLSTVFDACFGIEFFQPEDTSDYSTLSGIIVAEFATAVIPALVEEFAIRGVVMQSLRRYGDRFAVIMSSFVFALMHGNMVQIPFAFIAGIALGYAVIKTGSLWTGIIVHFINNSMAVLSMVAFDNLSERGSTIFTVGMYSVVFILGLICAGLYCKKNSNIFYGFSNGNIYYLNNGEKAKSFIANVPMALAIAILIAETAMYIN